MMGTQEWNEWDKELAKSDVSSPSAHEERAVHSPSSAATTADGRYMAATVAFVLTALVFLVVRPPFVVSRQTSDIETDALLWERVLLLSVLMAIFAVIAVPFAAKRVWQRKAVPEE